MEAEPFDVSGLRCRDPHSTAEVAPSQRAAICRGEDEAVVGGLAVVVHVGCERSCDEVRNRHDAATGRRLRWPEGEGAVHLEELAAHRDRPCPRAYVDVETAQAGELAPAKPLSTPSRVAELAAVVLLLVRSLSYSQQVQSVTQQAAEIAPHIEELKEQLEHYETMRAEPSGQALAAVDGLELVDVSFRYEPDVPVLHNISFAVESGESIGIVGPSGAGKSTLVQLLLRLRQPDAGSYLVGGLDSATVDLASWYRHFVFVPQDNRLLYGTVADNIAFYREGVDRADIEEAARRAQLRDDVQQWPDGYDTLIGRGAQDLSGGQTQRLGLARALLGRPSVLILDEPTSDRVLVLRDGQVEAFGPAAAAELRRTEGFYRETMGAVT